QSRCLFGPTGYAGRRCGKVGQELGYASDLPCSARNAIVERRLRRKRVRPMGPSRRLGLSRRLGRPSDRGRLRAPVYSVRVGLVWARWARCRPVWLASALLGQWFWPCMAARLGLGRGGHRGRNRGVVVLRLPGLRLHGLRLPRLRLLLWLSILRMRVWRLWGR